MTDARQTGKSTLVRALIPGPRRFHSLDDLDVVDLARRDPEALAGGREPVTLDEVQREPDLLLAIKRAVDRQRRNAPKVLSNGCLDSLDSDEPGFRSIWRPGGLQDELDYPPGGLPGSPWAGARSAASVANFENRRTPGGAAGTLS
ncbi:MAG: hypothetical protein QN172_08655 [Armatimonadota bacterium]|nr:hypothetical protein [Armatimonadota bacterium]